MIPSTGMAAVIGRLIGWAAVAASMVFIGLQLWRQAPWQLAATHLEPLAATVIFGALIYGMAGFLLSSAWHHLLGAGQARTSLRRHHAVYGRTQIAKYLPGNVFHLVGRQVMGRRLGHGQGRLALASMLETALLLLVAGCLSLPILWPWLDGSFLWVPAIVVLALAFMVARWLYGRHQLALFDLAARWDRVGPRVALSIASHVLRPALLYAGFFFVTAAILWMLAMSVTDPGRPALGLANSVSVVALAWLIGFATPGSSAGIGVREAVLIAMLEGALGAPASGLIAIALRVVSIGGDVIFFALGVALAPSEDQAKTSVFSDHSA